MGMTRYLGSSKTVFLFCSRNCHSVMNDDDSDIDEHIVEVLEKLKFKDSLKELSANQKKKTIQNTLSAIYCLLHQRDLYKSD